MARQLYDYWFVQFDFPDENGKPYKSSGGKMVWNDKLKRKIPFDWSVKELGALAEFRNGINYSKDEVGTKFPIVNVRNISSTTFLLDGETFDNIEIASGRETNYIITPDDIIIARSGCPGATRILLKSVDTLFCGFIICCTPMIKTDRNIIAFRLKQLEGTNATKSGGSILQNVSQDTLKRVLITTPSQDVLRKFNYSINLILEQLLLYTNEIKFLQTQRDELLPLLMNGQVSVMPPEVNCDLVLSRAIREGNLIRQVFRVASAFVVRNCNSSPPVADASFHPLRSNVGTSLRDVSL